MARNTGFFSDLGSDWHSVTSAHFPPATSHRAQLNTSRVGKILWLEERNHPHKRIDKDMGRGDGLRDDADSKREHPQLDTDSQGLPLEMTPRALA